MRSLSSRRLQKGSTQNFLMIQLPPKSTFFPYATVFRSLPGGIIFNARAGGGAAISSTRSTISIASALIIAPSATGLALWSPALILAAIDLNVLGAFSRSLPS